ncbi:hypothetical protein [Adhaeribacter radiodurans]|uniref:DUF4625 domain-containing protein n=1 Tax=Adhaeribacter radiodurans TaxID=2745197 RepID=A0A7L7L8G4_9BACT|nr:hypothetical protein [Adhaeribacter radiodurans]QMU29107.1 hypothetical protein HUW48_14130 [Adhaeribacter radiodurans]
MMQKLLLQCLTALILIISLTSCEDLFNNSDTKPDGSAPYVRLDAPLNNSVFMSGKTIPIQSLISDKDKIKELEVQVVNLADGSLNQTVWGYKKHPKTNPVIVDTTIKASSLPQGSYLLRMSLTDNRTNSKVKEVRFSIR